MVLMKKIFFSLLCSAAFAVASPVHVSLVNPGTPAITDSSRDYVGPYTLSIGGADVAAMCLDDFFKTSGSWNADLTAVNSGNLANTYLGNQSFRVDGTTLSSAQVYKVEAYFFSEIIQPGADRVDLQDAAWTFMDDVAGHFPHSTSTTVNNDIANALENYKSINAAGFDIVSQVAPGCDPEQEFIVATPEPASLGLLGGTLLLLGMMRIRSKRRITTAINS